MDALHDQGDQSGRTLGTTVDDRRAEGIAEVVGFAKPSRSATKNKHNELDFKASLSLQHLDLIRCKTPAERDRVLAIVRDDGIHKLPDGRPIEDVVLRGAWSTEA